MGTPGTPTLLTPLNASEIIGNALVFTFTIPLDPDNDKLVFRIELDTNNPISSSSTNYKKYESRFSNDKKTQGNWEIKDGSNYITMPTGGASSTYYGNEARITILKQDAYDYPNVKTTWYWRISASDALLRLPIFNQVIFGQAVFATPF
jgi:hypothetical protein